MAWSKICSPKTLGGLGFRPLRQLNMVSLAKLGWRFLKEKDSLWASVLSKKYDTLQKEGEKLPLRNFSHVWRSILWGKKVVQKGKMVPYRKRGTNVNLICVGTFVHLILLLRGVSEELESNIMLRYLSFSYNIT